MAVLYVVATPIGNLQDFSPRAAEMLRQADLIAAEDTRVTMKLCQVFDIHTRLTSCHRHNEENKSGRIAQEILEGDLTCALTTDAGTPCISDPGNELVAACVRLGIPVIPVPGCCAAVAAISVSGFDAREFTFYGFPPREKKALREKLRSLRSGAPVAVFHESPHRVTALTEAIGEIWPQARLAVCCDLTKKFEKTLYGSPQAVLDALNANPATEKGEYCIVIDLHAVPPEENRETAGMDVSPESLLIAEMKGGKTLREAQEALVAQGLKKNAVKQAALMLKRLFGSEEE